MCSHLSVGGVGSLNLWDSLADDGLGNNNGWLAVIETLCLGDGCVDGSEVVACNVVSVARVKMLGRRGQFNYEMRQKKS